METPIQQTPYIINTGGNSAIKPIVLGLLAVGGLYYGNKVYKQWQERQGEKNLDTPEGQIAMQLKNVFESTIVSDEDFRQVYLQVNSTNKDEVFKQYRLLTQRNLSDDIANHIGKSTLTKSVKTEAINSKKDGIIKIDANDNIQWLISRGSKVVFTNTKQPVWLYATPKSIIWNLTDPKFQPSVSPFDKIKISIMNRKDIMTVDGMQILPYDGIKLAEGWTKYFKPFVNTHKVFAIVRISLKDKTGKLKYLWVDAKDLSIATSLKGINEPKCIGDLIS